VAAPHVKLLSKKNQFVAWDMEGQQSLQFLTTKNDCALFAMAHHNKKRPNHLTLGRTFDHQILDLAEIGVKRFKSMKDYGGSVPKKRIGSKPMLLFVGDIWAQDVSFGNLQNLLVDFYRGEVVDKLILSGLDHIIVFTAANAPGMADPLIHQRTYFCKLKKNPAGGDKASPLPYLMACGPDMDFQLKRTQWAEPDMYKAARKQPAALKAKKVKNHTTNLFGETIGKLHISKQNVETMQSKKSKALRKAEKLEKEEDAAAIEQELEREKEDLKSSFRQTFGFDDEEEDERKKGKGKRGTKK
jgi:ribosome production factor 2